MLKNQRHLEIVNYVNKHQFVKVEKLSRLLNVSEITIRRDIIELHEEGILTKVHGGASISSKSTFSVDIELRLRRATNSEIKEALAQQVALLIPDNSVIYLDAGTSVALLIPYLRDRNIKVYTHGLHHVEILAQYNIETYIIGGLLKPMTFATVGSLSIKYLEMMSFDIAIMGFNALHREFGYSTPDEMEAMIKSTVIKQSNTVYFLGDDSKFDCKLGMTFASAQTGTLVTNTHPGDAFMDCNVIVIEEA